MAGLPKLSGGELRQRIEIMRAVRVDTGKGSDRIASWAVHRRPWAEVLGQDGREAVIAQALQGISSYRIRLRYRRDLLPDDQVRLNGPGGIDLNITSITDPNGDKEQLMLLASTESAKATS